MPQGQPKAERINLDFGLLAPGNRVLQQRAAPALGSSLLAMHRLLCAAHGGCKGNDIGFSIKIKQNIGCGHLNAHVQLSDAAAAI